MKLKMPLLQFTIISFSLCKQQIFCSRERLISEWMCSVSHVANLSNNFFHFLLIFHKMSKSDAEVGLKWSFENFSSLYHNSLYVLWGENAYNCEFVVSWPCYWVFFFKVELNLVVLSPFKMSRINFNFIKFFWIFLKTVSNGF